MSKKTIKNRSQETNVFKKLYFTASNPSAFGGKDRFIEAVKNKFGSNKKLLARAEAWLQGVDTYTRHKPALTGRTKQRRPIVVSGINSCWQIDLTDLNFIKKYNDNKRFILFVVDVFSRFAYVKMLKDKSGQIVAQALEEIFQSSKHVPMYIQSDLGKEFYNSSFKKLMKQYNIHHYHTENRDIKASIVERLQRTIKDKLYRYFTHSGGYRYVEALPKIIQSYNNSTHSSINIAPADVTIANQEEVWNQQHHANADVYDARHFSSRFKLGDTVRVSELKSTFQKGSLPNWSEQLYLIHKINPTVPISYALVDLSNEPIAGSWYSWELQKVQKPDVFKVENVLKKVNGRWRYFVKFEGYDDSFNDWVDKLVDYIN